MAIKKRAVKRKRRVGGVPGQKVSGRGVHSSVSGNRGELAGSKILKEIERLERKREKATTKESKLLYSVLINQQHDRLDSVIGSVTKKKN